MRRTLIKLLCIGLASLTTACTSTAEVESQPALLRPTATSLQTLTHAVSTALHGRSVRLAPDSLTQRPSLIMDPAFPIGPDGNPIMGRSTARPDHFNLVKRGKKCVLVHEETGKEMVLKRVKCVALK